MICKHMYVYVLCTMDEANGNNTRLYLSSTPKAAISISFLPPRKPPLLRQTQQKSPSFSLQSPGQPSSPSWLSCLAEQPPLLVQKSVSLACFFACAISLLSSFLLLHQSSPPPRWTKRGGLVERDPECHLDRHSQHCYAIFISTTYIHSWSKIHCVMFSYHANFWQINLVSNIPFQDMK